MGRRYLNGVDDDVEVATKWWNDYPTARYTDLAKAETCFTNMISGVWSKPKRLGRSASYTNLTYIKEAVHDYPIKRSTSISSLAPSLGLLPQYDRQAERIVHTTPVYKPYIYDWYTKAYNTSRFLDTHRELERPLRREVPDYERYSHVPFYTLQTKRIFFEERKHRRHNFKKLSGVCTQTILTTYGRLYSYNCHNNVRAQPYKSYLRQSQQYLDRYVSSRLKADDFAQQYVHTAYDWRKPQDYAFNRHCFYGAKVYVPHAPSNPHSYNSARSIRKNYRTVGRTQFA